MKNLLKKWLTGDTTWDEEKQLRRSAQKDDFLAEAMGGYDQFPDSDHTERLRRLQGRLSVPEKAQKSNVYYLSRVAAAAVLIGVIGLLFWTSNQISDAPMMSESIETYQSPVPVAEPEAPEIEMVEEADIQIVEQPVVVEKEGGEPPILPVETQRSVRPVPTPKKKAASPTVSTVEKPAPQMLADEQSDVLPESIDNQKTDHQFPVNKKETVASSTPKADYAQTETAPVPAASQDQPVPDAEDSYQNTYSDESAFAPQNQNEPAARVAKARAKLNYYVGAVQNEDGQPLNKVNITGLDNQSKTATDNTGVFVLKSAEPLSKIAISREGFHTREIEINQYSDYLNVVLEKKNTKSEADAYATTMAPRPAAGFEAFFTYLERNLRYPAAGRTAGVEREVEVKFFIDSTGTPTKLKVDNPDKYGFDKEAIRLLENGPKWQPINTHARYYVTFAIE